MATYKSNDIQKIAKFWNERGLNQQRNAIAFCWNTRANDFSWLGSGDIYQQFRQFKKQKCYADEENNVIYTDINGKVWYGLTISHDSIGDLDSGALAIAGVMVSGFVYWFEVEKNRDAMFGYINKKKF